MPGDVPKVVEAERFVLRDPRGRVCAVLSSDADGLPNLLLYDGRNKTRVVLTLMTDGTPELRFFDENSKTCAVLGLFPDGSMGLGLAGSEGNVRRVQTK